MENRISNGSLSDWFDIYQFPTLFNLFQSFSTKSQMDFDSRSNGSRLLADKMYHVLKEICASLNDPEFGLRLNDGR